MYGEGGERVVVRWSGLGAALSSCVRRLSLPGLLGLPDAPLGCSSPLTPDVTISAAGRQLRAHKFVLAACSPLFASIFQENPFENPIIVLQDVSFTALSAIISYMYNGEVSVTEEYLPILVKTAECLQIKGLSMADNVDDEIESESTHCDKLESTIETIIIKQEVVSDDENCCIENVDVILDEVVPKTEHTNCADANIQDEINFNDSNEGFSTLVTKDVVVKKKRTNSNIKRIPKAKRNKVRDKSTTLKSKIFPKIDKENEKLSTVENQNAHDEHKENLSNFDIEIESVLQSTALTSALINNFDTEDTCCLNSGINNDINLNENDMRPNFPCPFCNRIYFSWGYRRRHVKARHEPNSLSCKWCLIALDSETAWFEHVVNNHGISYSQARDSLIIMVEAHTVLSCSSPPSPVTMLDHLKLDNMSIGCTQTYACDQNELGT